MPALTSLKRKWRTARSLGREEWLLIAEAWGLLVMVDLLLRALPFYILRQIPLRNLNTSESQSAPQQILGLQGPLEIATRNYAHRVRCLQRSLVLQWLLARRGVRTELRIGVRKETAQLAAHAWLEYAGQPIADNVNTRAHFALLLPQEMQP